VSAPHPDPLAEAQDPLTPPERLLELAQDANVRVRQGVARHKSASPALLERLAHDPDWTVVCCVARRRDLWPELLSVLGRSSERSVYELVAANPKTPPETLRELVGKYMADCCLARNPRLPPDLLEAFVRDLKENIVADLLKNPSLSADQIERLAQYALAVPKGRGLGFFYELVHHHHTTAQQLERWAQIPLTEVHYRVAQAPRTPARVLEYLARVASHDILSSIVHNPNVTPQILELLAYRAVEMQFLTDEQILQTPEGLRPIFMSDRTGNALLNTLVQHPLCPRSAFDLLLPNTDAEQLKVLVQSVACPGDVLEHLWLDLERLGLNQSLEVLGHFARNPNCPPQLLEQLSHRPEREIVEKVAQNPACPPEVLERMFQGLDDLLPGLRGERLRVLARNPSTPAAILEQISRQTDWQVLEALAQNPNCPPDVLLGIRLEAVFTGIKLKNNPLGRPKRQKKKS